MALIISAMGWSATSVAAPPPCLAFAPTDLTAVHARWLGGCEAGRAAGLGVLRVGSHAPFQFYAGRMQAGRPVQGVLVLDNGTQMVAARFDSKLRAIPGDSLRPAETEATFAVAASAAKGVAGRFRRNGNASSAIFYTHLAGTLQPSE